MEMMGRSQGGPRRGRNVLQACRVYADGHDECVHGAQVLGLGAEAFKGIVAASSTPFVMHGPPSHSGGIFGAGGEGPGLATFVVPSLLFEDLTVSKTSGEVPKPPFSAPPPPLAKE
jgi:hypothetical protein